MYNLEDTAKLIATVAHAAVAQYRNDGVTPYIVHPGRVAAILATVPHSVEMKAAAWLHDVVEDTGVTLEVLSAMMPSAVVQMVDDLTKKEDMNLLRAERKQRECVRLSSVSNDSKTIKLADVIDNLCDLDHNTEEFCDLFVKEKSELLPSLEGGDATLMFRAKQLIEDYYAAKKRD